MRKLISGVLLGVFVCGLMAVSSGDLGMWVKAADIRRAIKDVGASATLTTKDANKIIRVTAADIVVTLPATSSRGSCFTFILENGALSAGTGLSISPAAADAIHGGGLTSVDNKDLILAGATDAEGDTVTLCMDGDDGYYITSSVGTWSKEA